MRHSSERRAGRVRTVLLTVVGGVAALLLTAVGAVYALSARELGRRYAVPEIAPLTIPDDSASIARGAHFARTIGSCILCHGPDLGGAVYIDAGPLGVVRGPNLTKGRGGIGEEFAVADWVRAIRYGVHRDGTSLIVMPSEVFVHMSDSDLAALIAYLQSLPPVDRDIGPTQLRLVGRAMLAAGKLPILVAPKTPRPDAPATLTPGATPEYGRYLATVSGCHGCHGDALSGGAVNGPPGSPPAANLTPTGIGAWTEADFVRAMREGKRPDETVIDPIMPWNTLGGMSDEELRALWLYVRTLPPRESVRR